MRNRINHFLFVIVTTLIISTVWNTNLIAAATLNNDISNDSIPLGAWFLVKEKDDFGDELEGGESFLTTRVKGTFSNSATASDELLVDVLMKDAGPYHNDIWFYFYLYEYAMNPVTPILGDTYTMKIKDEAGDIFSFELEVFPPDNAIAFIDHGRADGKHMYDCLCLGQSIRCIIECGFSKYNFTITSNNFVEACAENGYEIYKEVGDAIDVVTALQLLNEEKQWDYGDRITEALLHLFDEIEPMTTEEIAEVIKPGYWSINDPQWNKHNVEYEFYEDGTYQSYNSSFGIKYAWKIEDGYLQTALISKGDVGNWQPHEIRKIRDGYYLLGSGEEESTGYDVKVIVELDDNLNVVYPLE